MEALRRCEAPVLRHVLVGVQVSVVLDAFDAIILCRLKCKICGHEAIGEASITLQTGYVTAHLHVEVYEPPAGWAENKAKTAHLCPTCSLTSRDI